jgi:hypothetical protein
MQVNISLHLLHMAHASTALYCKLEANRSGKSKVLRIKQNPPAQEILVQSFVLPDGSAGQEPVTSR